VPREGRQRIPRAARAHPHRRGDGADWLEAQLHIVDEIGKERYLAEQIHD
jgi:hypothetical protein